MALLGNRYNFIDDEEDNEEEVYTLPAVVRKNDDGINFKNSLVMSTVLHPVTVALIWLFIFILSLLGINFLIFNKPDMTHKKDIEFVLVDHEAMPRNPNTKNRADMNSRSGGKNNPKKPVSMPSASKSKPSSSASSLQKMIQKQQKQIQREQKQVIKQQHVQQQRAAQTPAPKKQQTSQAPRPSAQRPAPPTVAPSARPVSAPPKVALKPSSPFAVPVPSGLPAGKSLSTGPVGGTSSHTATKSSGGYASGGGSHAGRYAPAPSLAPSRSGGNGGGQLARGGGGTGGNVGNPGGGGGRPGIDAVREPDFGPYMRELQRRIKLNWNPPKGNESKRVVLLFKIAKSGRMLSCRVLKSSGLPAADQAALRAVELTAPFRPLPAEFKGQSIDIQFTFDYNVFGARY